MLGFHDLGGGNSNIFGIFTPIWGRFPFWLTFFRWVETTNQMMDGLGSAPLAFFCSFFFRKKESFRIRGWSRTDYRYQKQAQVEVIVEIRWVLPTLNLFFKLPRGPHIPFTLCHFWWFSEFPKDMWSFPGVFFFRWVPKTGKSDQLTDFSSIVILQSKSWRNRQTEDWFGALLGCPWYLVTGL